MSIRNLINRLLDSEFGALPATRGIGHVAVAPLAPAATPKPARISETAWVRHNLVGSHGR